MFEALTFRSAHVSEIDWLCTAIAFDIDLLPIANGAILSVSDSMVRSLIEHDLLGYSFESFQVAVVEDEAAGFVHLVRADDLLPVLIGSSMYNFAPTIADLLAPSDVVLNAIYVEPKFRGLGIGRFMIEWALQNCRDEQRLSLLYSDINAAHSLGFYTKLGFVARGRTGNSNSEIYLLCSEKQTWTK